MTNTLSKTYSLKWQTIQYHNITTSTMFIRNIYFIFIIIVIVVVVIWGAMCCRWCCCCRRCNFLLTIFLLIFITFKTFPFLYSQTVCVQLNQTVRYPRQTTHKKWTGHQKCHCPYGKCLSNSYTTALTERDDCCVTVMDWMLMLPIS